MKRGRASKNTTITDDGPSSAKVTRQVIMDLTLPVVPTVAGILLTCGTGDMGQLGLGEDVFEKKNPALVDSVKNVVDVCAGGMHNLCLTKTGEVFSFGCNDEGALGRVTEDIDGAEFNPAKVNLPEKVIKMSCGDSHSACLLEDGRVFAWGSFRDSHGNMGLTLEGNKRVPIDVLPGIKNVDIASGSDHLVILTSVGQIYTVGCAEQGQLGRVSSRSAGGESRRGKTELLKPGLVFFRNQKRADAVWASGYCTYFREQSTQNILGFGLNNYNQLGLTTKTDLPIFVPKLSKFTNVKTIAGGIHHTLVLTNDGECYAIGRKEYGRLGLGDVAEDIEELQQVPSLKNKKIVEIACGEISSFAITQDGKIYSWGMGTSLQLGTGNEDDELIPALLTGKQVKDKNVIKVASGGQHTVFIVEDESANAVETTTKPVAAAAKTDKKKTSTKAEKLKENGKDSSEIETMDTSNVDEKEKPVAAAKTDKKKGATKAVKPKDNVKDSSDIETMDTASDEDTANVKEKEKPVAVTKTDKKKGANKAGKPKENGKDSSEIETMDTASDEEKEKEDETAGELEEDNKSEKETKPVKAKATKGRKKKN